MSDLEKKTSKLVFETIVEGLAKSEPERHDIYSLDVVQDIVAATIQKKNHFERFNCRFNSNSIDFDINKNNFKYPDILYTNIIQVVLFSDFPKIVFILSGKRSLSIYFIIQFKDQKHSKLLVDLISVKNSAAQIDYAKVPMLEPKANKNKDNGISIEEQKCIKKEKSKKPETRKEKETKKKSTKGNENWLKEKKLKKQTQNTKLIDLHKSESDNHYVDQKDIVTTFVCVLNKDRLPFCSSPPKTVENLMSVDTDDDRCQLICLRHSMVEPTCKEPFQTQRQSRQRHVACLDKDCCRHVSCVYLEPRADSRGQLNSNSSPVSPSNKDRSRHFISENYKILTPKSASKGIQTREIVRKVRIVDAKRENSCENNIETDDIKIYRVPSNRNPRFPKIEISVSPLAVDRKSVRREFHRDY